MKELNVLKQLTSMIDFDAKEMEEPEEDKTLGKSVIGFMDTANVMMFRSDSKLIEDFMKKRCIIKKWPDLDYEEGATAKYSLSYLKKILRCLDVAGADSAIFKMRNDFPMTIEYGDLNFVLAPRVDDSEGWVKPKKAIAKEKIIQAIMKEYNSIPQPTEAKKKFEKKLWKIIK